MRVIIRPLIIQLTHTKVIQNMVNWIPGKPVAARALWKGTTATRGRTLSPMSAPVHTAFGQWLKKHRRDAGITQDELSRVLACSPITLQKIEAGERRPSR